MAKVIASGIFLVRKDRKLLICHPTNHDKDFFSIPKGKVEKDETFLQGAIRETFEETNIQLEDSNNFYIFPLKSVNYKHNKKVIHPYLFIEKSESKINWDEVEIKCNSNVPLDRGGFPEMDGFRWVDLEESRNFLHETQVACIDSINEILEK